MIRYISKEERDMAQSILIVDDERDIVSMLNQYFCKIGYVVYTAINGKEALNAITKHPDIILLDINMPDMNGFTICEKIRNFVSCPIIFLTARIENCDKIKGFAVGGDDYVVKPFSVDELEARVAAHLRREKRHGSSAIVQFDNNIVIDYSSRVVFYRNAEINFTKKEFDIIEFLSQNKGIIFDRETIYEKVWGLDGSGDNSVITEHIRRIRTKFLSIGDNPYIETVWGCGYKWKK
ncbi:response regulator [Ruminococcus sp. MCC718]|jgi:subtilin biosynthesis regulatory protein spaR|uniref:Stage 0 sporulation protein A homolog n=2 Tax=root TaxID=1 RepID=A0A6L8TDC5_9FIRM|nr:response regulator [Roseburia inulinivorans]MBT9653039.1 response regulator [Ruminococcus sp. MCC718]MBT9740634.1 response regulator [Dorea formicigenerans]MZL52775.1 response regulator [Blautia massiliensis (ex Durand et al. 2017)]NSG47321.1 response regulator transcription factor [Mediterraneibacter gnavus]